MKSVKYLNEPCFMNKDGEVVPYLPKEIITHRDAYAASLHILLEHTAKFHVLVAEIIAEKYNLDVNEMMKTVREDSRFQLSVSDPGLNALGYFDEKDLEKKVASASVVEAVGEPVKPEGEPVKPEGEPVKPEGEPVKPEGEPVKLKKKVIRAKKASAEAVAQPSAEHSAQPSAEPVAKPVTKPKKILKKV